MKRQNDFESDNSKKPKSNLQWVTGYREKISNLDSDRSLNVTLSYGMENGSLKRTLVHIRVYNKNYPTSDGFSFNPEEIDFIIPNMKKALDESDFKCSKKFGTRNIILKSDIISDSKQVSFGTRKDRFSKIRTFPKSTVELLLPVLERMSYVCNNSGINLGENVFEHIYSSMIFSKIEKNETKYDQTRDLLLSNETLLEEHIEDVFDFFDQEIMDGVYRNCSAFGISKKVISTKGTMEMAKSSVKSLLNDKFYQKNSFLQYQKIASLNMVRNLMK